tara:strand:+ start:51 stop:239 length:189 start_codon:yes stop_codon:yes gene_type:complete
MPKYRCEKCYKKKEIKKETFIFENGKLIAKEAKCECGSQMKCLEKYEGFGTSFQAPNDKYRK